MRSNRALSRANTWDWGLSVFPKLRDACGSAVSLGQKPKIMANTDSRVTIHMAASLDGFIARKDGRVDWLETSDEFAGGGILGPRFVETLLKKLDCYGMGGVRRQNPPRPP